MLTNYLKIAFRNLWRNKVYTLINLLGLAIGITSCILIFLWLADELSYDQRFVKSQAVYRVTMDWHSENGKVTPVATSQTFASNFMQKKYPEIKDITRVYYGFMGQEMYVKVKENKFYEANFRFVDSAFFKIFKYEFLAGNPQTALQEPNSIILTKNLATKFFGSISRAMNQVIEMDNQIKLKVSGVMEDCPRNSHFQFSALIPSELLKKTMGENWKYSVYWTYVSTSKNTNYKNLDTKIAHFTRQESKARFKNEMFYVVHLQPITDIHLRSTHLEGDTDNSNILYVYAFGAIVIFILIIASVNYINLATARAVERAKEVGIRKVVGSLKNQLIAQFLFESMILVLLALFVGLSLLEIVLSFFNQLADKQLFMNYYSPLTWLFLGSFVLILGLLSGLYPAFVLSSFKPVLVLKGKFGNQRQGLWLRQGLVVFQFTLSLIVIMATWTTYQQLNFMLNQDLGFKTDRIVVMPLQDENWAQKVSAIKQEIKKSTDIQQVSTSSFAPGTWGVSYASMTIEVNEAIKTQRFTDVTHFYIDEDYIPMMAMKVILGRNFDKKISTDFGKAVIINETLAQKLGWKNPLGKTLKHEDAGMECKIIGVVKDIHFKSLHKRVEPMALFYAPQGMYQIMAKINGQRTKEALAHLNAVWNKFDSKHPFKYFFLEQSFLKNYQKDQNRANLFIAFSLLTILIACLGLFGLVSFTILKRAKEISIRKVLGASVNSIMILLSGGFLKLIGMAAIVALPFAYWAMKMILENYAYRIELNWVLFFMPIILVLAVALLTIGFQTFKASQRNPVDNLKYE